MEYNADLYRLEGSNDDQTGGLIIRKKVSDHTFKKPQASVLGLDKLAQRKRRENSQEPSGSSPSSSSNVHTVKSDLKDRQYRTYEEETPTHTGGVNTEAQRRLESRMNRQRLDARDRMYRDHRRDQDRRKERDRDRDRSRSRLVQDEHLLDSKTNLKLPNLKQRIHRLEVIGTMTMTRNQEDPAGIIQLLNSMDLEIQRIPFEVNLHHRTSTTLGIKNVRLLVPLLR